VRIPLAVKHLRFRLALSVNRIAYHKEFGVTLANHPFEAKNNQIAKVIETP
jgi:hypothetical protein